MTARPEVGFSPPPEEPIGAPNSRAALMRRRQEVSAALAEHATSFALETLTDEEFDSLLAADKLRQERVKKFITNRLQEGLHYGKVTGIDKPFAWETGADELLKLFRFAARPVEAPTVSSDKEFCEATVTVGIFDQAGHCVASATRSCNTIERRFYKGGGAAPRPKFRDPRECANEVVSMATKRAKVAAVLSACSAKSYFASPELLEEDAGELATAEQRQQVFNAAKEAGIKTAGDFGAFCRTVLGREDVDEIYESEVPKLLAALAARKTNKHTPVKDASGEGYTA